MKKNMGTIDRLIRTAIAVLIAVLYFTGQISGLAAVILGIIAVAFLVTSLFARCPAYLPLNISTTREK
jgi:Na+(H+)/acetate symporter ActP